MAKTKKDRIIIVGCGRLGSSIADMLSAIGHGVTVIDMKETEFRKLSGSYGGFTVEGDGTDIDVLKEANADRAGLFIAATDDDDTNIMAAEIAKVILKIPRVVVRVKDTSKRVAYSGLDIESIFPAELSRQEFLRITGLQKETEIK
ncbi:MAG: NAD-binding protein [Oscillospiraceae bacterium]|jgi:trk system potassium uptake protein TrkA|nr:NAD-binding protein [Oscillospiraceae bacterium]